ncbi:hypothetical protein E8E14_004328 [Neopestalotiopsis sp. 37M]|nr:hypothetical protein E8E14_004328 [Neopestalotiopsis sp. 37M]
MDYGYTNDLHPLSLHRLDDWSVRDSIESMPEGYNPFIKHYEETEREANHHFHITGHELANKIPPEFGALSHPNTLNGQYYIRFDKGDDHGMSRPEDNGAYEAAKFNQRINPRIDRVGNHNRWLQGSAFSPTEDDLKAGSLVHFPNIGGLVTSGMYRSSDVPFTKDEAIQNSPFFKMLWDNADIRELLMEKLFGHAEALSNLTRSCQRIRRDVENNIGYFDTTALNFHHCDRFPDDLENMVQKGRITQEEVDNIRVPKFLVVGPGRKPQTMAPGYTGDPTVFWPPQVQDCDSEEAQSHEDLFNEHGFRIVDGYSRNEKKMTYKRQCGAVQRALIAFNQHRDNYNYLALVQMDFMNITTVKAIVTSLKNLKCLCIYSCPLIDLSRVREVIQLVGRINEKRRAANRPHLDLDIAPQLRQGHLEERMGSYGITHSDPRIFQGWGTDAGHALAANLVSLIRAAKEADIELCQPGKAFRRWIDRLPLAINQAYNLCAAAANYVAHDETRVLYASAVYPDAQDSFEYEALIKAMDETVAMDLTIAAIARPFTRTELLVEGYQKCTKCDETLPGILFRYEARQRHPNQIICEGCDLNNQLGLEIGNNHYEKNQIAGALWHDAPNDKPSIRWLLGTSKIALRNNKQFLKTTEQLKTPEACMVEVESMNEGRKHLVQLMVNETDRHIKAPLGRQLKHLDQAIEDLKVRAGYQRKPETGNESMYDWEYRRQAYHWRGTVERGEFIHGAPYENHTMLSLEKAFNMRH